MKLVYENPVATCIDELTATITYDITDDWGETRYDQEMEFTGNQSELRKRLRDLKVMGAFNIEVDTEPCFFESMNEDTDYDRQLLGRLISDCKYFLGNGNGAEKHLWAGSVKDQIAKMRELYNSFPKGKKPDGITLADIDAFEEEMLNKLNDKKESYRVYKKDYKKNNKQESAGKDKIKIGNLNRYWVTDDDYIPLHDQPEKGYTKNQAISRAQREAERLTGFKRFNLSMKDAVKYFHIMDSDGKICHELDNAI